MISESADDHLDLDMFLPQRISMLARLTQAVLGTALARCGLTVAHWRIFHCLTRLGPSDLNTIADFTVLPQSSVSRSVARLVELGLVDSQRGHENRRHLEITITSAGREVLATAIRDVQSHWQRTFPLPPEEARAFTQDINRIIDALSAQRTREAS